MKLKNLLLFGLCIFDSNYGKTKSNKPKKWFFGLFSLLFVFMFLFSGVNAATGNFSKPDINSLYFWNYTGLTDLWSSNTQTWQTASLATSQTVFPTFNILGNSSPNSYYFNSDTNRGLKFYDDNSIGSGDFAYYYWVKFDAVNVLQYLHSKRSGADAKGFDLVLDNSNGKVFLQVDLGASFATIYTDDALSIDTWYLIGFERESGTLKLYLNTVLEDTIAGADDISSNVYNYIATSGAGTSRLKGNLDNIMIFKRALTNNERENMFNYGAILLLGSGTNATITAKNIYSNVSITNFSVNFNSTNYFTSTGTITIPISSIDTNFWNITFFNMSNYINRTYTNYNFIASGNLEGELFNKTQTDRIRFLDATNSSAIVGATVTVTTPSGVISSKTTNSTGHINFSIIKNSQFEEGVYLFQFEKAGHITLNFNETINFTTIPLDKTYSVSLARILITVYNINGSRIYDEFNVDFLGESYSVNTVTNTSGVLNLIGLFEDYYKISVYNGNYTNPSFYYVNFTNREILELNAYVSATSAEKTFYTKNTLNLPVQNALLTFTELQGSNYVTIGQIQTDGLGFGSIFLQNNKQYNLLIEADGYETKTTFINTLSTLTTYSFVLTTAQVINFTSVYDLFSFYIEPTTEKLNKTVIDFKLIASSEGSYLTWFAVYDTLNNLSNVTGSPSGGTATLTIDLTNYASKYKTIYYAIKVDGFAPLVYQYNYFLSEYTGNFTYMDSKDDLTGLFGSDEDKGVMAILIIIILNLCLSMLFPIDRPDGTKSFNAVSLPLLIGFLAFIGFVSLVPAIITSFLFILTLIQRGD